VACCHAHQSDSRLWSTHHAPFAGHGGPALTPFLSPTNARGCEPKKQNRKAGDSPVEVSAKITGLTPNTAASYRVLAGFYGPIASPEVGFTTAKIAAPALETKGSGGVGETKVGASSATLYASVNPRGATLST
jgi:hypothetical protein